jgi:ketosteroid isomerase-like protein
MNVDTQAFAAEWIAAWNGHDLERVLSHYSTDIVFLSPIAQAVVGDGRVIGISALRSYWGQALAARSDLKFELLDVLVGHECLTVLYRNHRGQHAAETFELGGDGKIIRSFACYGQPGAAS